MFERPLCKVDNAIILAAGIGSRFTPISLSKPKGLVEVNGVPLVERQIRHLLEADVTDITVVTGYLAEQFDYLKRKFGVKTIFNPDYAVKNNLASLYCVKDLLRNTYILSSDNYMSRNIYSAYEPHAWYSCVFADGDTKEWCVDADDDGRITDVSVGGNGKWYMYGSVFFDAAFSAKFVPLLERYANMSSWDGKYWEDILAAHTDDLEMYIRKFDGNVVYEFENLEELRVFDRSYLSDSRDPYIAEIKRLMSVGEADITNYAPYDSRNESKVFRFSIGQRSYAAKLHSDTKKYGFENTPLQLYEGALLTVYDLG